MGKQWGLGFWGSGGLVKRLSTWTGAQTGISQDLANKCSFQFMSQYKMTKIGQGPKLEFPKIWPKSAPKGHLCGAQPILKVIRVDFSLYRRSVCVDFSLYKR